MHSRQRNRGRLEPQGPVSLNLVIPDIVPIYGWGECSSKYSSKMEEMHDVIGNQKSDYNPCDHDKLLSLLKPLSYFASGPDGEGRWTQYSFGAGGPFPTSLLQSLRSLDLFGPNYLENFSIDAELFYKKAVDDSTSLINFIIELIQLCEMNVNAWKKFSKKMETAIQVFFRMLKKTGNYWVAWNFAIKPTVRDIWAFLTSYKRALKRLMFLRARNHKDTKLKFRRSPIPVSGTQVPVGYDWWTGTLYYQGEPVNAYPVDWGGFLIDYEGTVQVSSWAHVMYDIDDNYLNDMFTAIGMIMLCMNGVYNPIKIAWEATPFSWLIEWFTNKKIELLKELGNLSPFRDAEILGMGHSIRLKLDNAKAYAWKTGESAQGFEIGEFQYSRFTRRQGLPTGESALVAADMNPTRSAILGGIAANWRRRR